jgi:uncharacterized protein YuzE
MRLSEILGRASNLLHKDTAPRWEKGVSHPDAATRVNYDELTDLLEVTTRDCSSTKTYEVQDRVYVQLDSETTEVVGLEIVDCSARLGIDRRLLRTGSPVIRDLIQRYGPLAQQLRAHHHDGPAHAGAVLR